MHLRQIILMLALVLALPACAAAQNAMSDSVQHRNRCRLAAQIVRTGTPAPHAEWAYEFIAYCGSEGGAAVAAGIRESRHSSNVEELEQITRATLDLTDGQVFEAALDVAGDGAGTKEARVIAFRTLIRAVSPGRVISYAQLSASSCFGLGAGLHFEAQHGTPLPADYSARIAQLATRIAADASAPPEVQRAAACTTLYFRHLRPRVP